MHIVVLCRLAKDNFQDIEQNVLLPCIIGNTFRIIPTSLNAFTNLIDECLFVCKFDESL